MSTAQAKFDDPDLTGPGPVPDIVCGDWWEGGGGPGNEIDFFEITLTEDTGFRLGILADQTGLYEGRTTPADVLYESPMGIRVRASDDSADSGMIDTLGPEDAWRNGDIDYFFFDVSGQAGDIFIVSGLNDDRWSDFGMAGVTFDAVPEPSTLMMLTALAMGALTYRGARRRRRAQR